MRKEYHSQHRKEEQLLSPSASPQEPMPLFEEWYREAVAASRITGIRDREGKEMAVELYEPYAMVLATITPDHRPRTRVVLMREFSSTGLIFYTNYRSAKGKELEAYPQASANFYWPALDRQVRIEGKIEKTTAEKSRSYFDSRPPGSRIGAVVSRQSEVLPHRQDLIREMNQHQDPPPCPDHWGGYLLRPDYFEFWLGRTSRLHERLVYRLSQKEPESTWEKFLLYP